MNSFRLVIVYTVVNLLWYGSKGYTLVSLSSSLQSNIQVDSKGWTKVTTWYTPASTGHATSGLSSSHFTNGDFKAPYTALYSVYATITLSASQEGIYKTAAWINNDKNTIHPGLISTFKNANGFRSLSIYGVTQLEVDHTLSIYVYSETSEPWVIIGNSESTFCMEFNGYYGYIPGFSSYYSKDTTFIENELHSLGNWKSSNKAGLFKSQTGFSDGSGTFYPICDGIYQVSANILFSSRSPGKFELAISLNDDTKGNNLMIDEKAYNSSFTLSISLTLSLKRGDKISAVTKADVPYDILTESGFSAILINRGYHKTGFSTIFPSAVTGNGITWINIPIPLPTDGYGQFIGDKNSLFQGRYYHSSTKFFIISGVIHIKALTPRGIAVSLVSDGSRLLTSTNGVLNTRTDTDSAKTQTYSVAGLLELTSERPLSLYMHLSTQEYYEILPGSRLSITSSQPDYPAFNLVYIKQVSYIDSGVWLKLDQWSVSKDGSFMFTNNFRDDYVADVSGIYFMTANIIFHDASGPVSALLSLNGGTSKRQAISVTNGNPSAIRETLSLSGSFFIKQGSKLAVHVNVEDDFSWSIGSESSFSCVYIGNEKLVPGVSTILKSRLPVSGTGWKKFTSWDEQSLQESFYDTRDSMDYVNGEYAVPMDGFYLVSANVKLQEASEKGSEFKLNIALNGNPGSYTDQNGLQDYLKINSEKPFSNDYYSLAVSGVIKCSKDDLISVYMNARGDNKYSISQDSTLSIVFVSSPSSYYAHGIQLMLEDGISQQVKSASSWKKVQYWTYQRLNTAPQLFSTGNLIELDGTDGTIIIKESGLYFISINVGIGNGNDNFEIGIHTSDGISSLNTKYGKTSSSSLETRSSYTMKGFAVMFLTKSQRISIKIRSDAGSKSWENLRAFTGWSLLRIPPFEMLPSLMSAVQSHQTISTGSGLWSRITSWDSYVTSYQLSGTSNADFNAGTMKVTVDGLYAIAVTVVFKTTLENDEFIKFKIGVNGDTTIPGAKILNSGQGPSYIVSDCNSVCSYSLSNTVLLKDGNTIAVYIQSSKSSVIIDTPLYIAIQYILPAVTLPIGFSMKLSNTQSINSIGGRKLTEWIFDKNNQITYFNELGINSDTYQIPRPGVYLVMLHLEVLNFNGLLKVVVLIDNIISLSATQENTAEHSFTIRLAGVLKLSKDAQYSINILSEQDSAFSISEESYSSLAYLSENQHGFVAQFESAKRIANKKNEVIPLTNWLTTKPNKLWLFDNDNGFQGNQMYVVQKTGLYLIGTNMIIKNSVSSHANLKIYVIRNGDVTDKNKLIGKTVLPSDNTKTINLIGGMFLNKWDSIEIRFELDIDNDIFIKEESTFFVIEAEGDRIPYGCVDHGPNIITSLTPLNPRLEFASSIEWKCLATGDNPSYHWEKNSKVISGERSNVLQLASVTVDQTGSYACVATSRNIKVSSNIATLYVFDPNPNFLNNKNDFIIKIKENGETPMQLLFIKARAQSYESGDTEMEFKLIGDVNNEFSIDPIKSTSGTVLSSIKPLDREVKHSYHLKVQAISPTIIDSERIQNISIELLDENDNPPMFEFKIYNVKIPEDIQKGSNILNMTAFDKDLNNTISYSVIPGSAVNDFKINSQTGELTVTGSMDRELRDMYVLIATASDGQFTSYCEINIKVSDINDHTPYFIKTVYHADISETLSVGMPIITVLATDKDSGNNSKIVYTITSGNTNSLFMINELGTIQLANFLNNNNQTVFTLTISIRDSGKPPLVNSNKATVTLTVREANDNRPIFSQPEYKADMIENTLNATLQVFARDSAGNDNAISYSIPERHQVSDTFAISPKTGLISLKQPLDFERQKFYQFSVDAKDTGLPPKIASAYILVSVVDQNDNIPVFTNKTASISVIESADTGRVIYRVSATDDDSGANGQINYALLSGNTGNRFYVNHIGAVIADKPLDREVTSSYQLKINAFDSGVPSKNASTPFILTINIKDSNDNAPRFDKTQYKIEVDEDVTVGTSLLSFTVADLDNGVNKEFDLQILEERFKNVFTIRKVKDASYELVLQEQLDYEFKNVFYFALNAKDKGVPSLERSASVSLRIKDVNDNPPNFQSNVSVVLSQILIENFIVYQVVAIDPDIGPGGKLKYTITEGNEGNVFKIDSFSGVVETNNITNLKSGTQYTLIIVATDSFVPPLVSNPLALTITTTAKFELQNTTVGQFQFETSLSLKEFSHLTNVRNMEVLVQRYRPQDPSFNTLTNQLPTSWHTVFHGAKTNQLRRYVALDIQFPINKRIQRRSIEKVPETISVIIGRDKDCTKVKFNDLMICNGPLAPNEGYRMQVQIYEGDNSVPVQSHFSQVITLNKLSGASSSAQFFAESEDGMLAMAATFGLVYLTACLVILIYICWKQRHELLHLDHLRERRDIIEDNYMSGREFYAASEDGSIDKKYSSYDADSTIWQDIARNQPAGALQSIDEQEETFNNANLEEMNAKFNEGFQDQEQAEEEIEEELEEKPKKRRFKKKKSSVKKSKNEEESFEENVKVKEEEMESSSIPTFDIQPMDIFSDDNQDASSNEPIYESADKIKYDMKEEEEKSRKADRKKYAIDEEKLSFRSESAHSSKGRKALIGQNVFEQEDDDDDSILL